MAKKKKTAITKKTSSPQRRPKRINGHSQKHRLRYQGRFITKDLEQKIRDARKELVSKGRFISYKDLLAEYFEVEAELEKRKETEPLTDLEKLERKALGRVRVEYNRYLLNGVLERLQFHRSEVGAGFKVEIIGIGETKPKTYDFDEAMAKLDKELSFIWYGLELYRDAYGEPDSPLFWIPMAFNYDTGRAYVNVNDLTANTMNRDALLNLIEEVKFS